MSTYEVLFVENVEDWDADQVKRAFRNELRDQYERIEFLYLRGQREGNKGLCVVDLYAGACRGGDGVRDVMNVFWNLYGVSMKYRPYTLRCRPYTLRSDPWEQFEAPKPTQP